MAARLVLVAAIAVVVFADPDAIDTTQWSEFSLTKLPTASSPVVLGERNSIRSAVNFQALASDFRALDVLARDASRESSNFGDAALQSHIQGLVSKVSGLIGKSGSTVGSFKGTTDAALRYLAAAFLSITDDDNKKAIEGLQKVSELAKSMTQLSAELKEDSDKDGERSQKVLEEVLKAQGVAKQRKTALEEKQRQLEASKKGMEALARSAQEAEGKAKEMARQADEAAARARKKRKKKKSGWRRIGHALGKLVGHDDTKKYKDRERAAREEQRKFNEQRQAHQNKYTQAQREIQELERAMKKLQFDTNRADSTINALQKLIGTFKSLSTTTHKVVGVWERLQLLCETLHKNVEKVGPGSPVNREAAWSSPYFQARAVQLYSRWLALREESSTYLQASNQIKHEEL